MMMEVSSTLSYDKTYRHLEALDFAADGGLVVGASNLNGRYWTGSLSYHKQWTAESASKDVVPVAVSYVDSGVTDAKWIRDTQKLVASCDSGALTMWELSSEKNALNLVSQPLAHDDVMTCCSVNCDVTKLLTASLDHSICVWDVQELNVLSSYTGHSGGVMRAEFHPTSPQVFLSCSQDGTVLLWDTRKEKPASRVEDHLMSSKPTCVAWQPGNEYSIAIATESGCILLQDSRRGVGTPVRVKVHLRPTYRLVFAPHRRGWLASASNDSTAAVTAFENNGCHIVYADKSCHKDFVQGVAWNPVDHHLVTCSWDGSIVTRKIEETQVNGGGQDEEGVVKEEQLVNGS